MVTTGSPPALPSPTPSSALGAQGEAAGLAAGAAEALVGEPSPLVPTWLLSCYFCIVVGGGIIANVLLLVTAVRGRFGRRQPSEAVVPGKSQWHTPL